MSVIEAQQGAVAEVIEAIEDGTFDLFAIEAIEQAIKDKRNELAAGWRKAIRPGFKVRVVSSVSPKWMAGRTGVVTGVSGRRFTVELDYPHTMRNGRTCRTLNAYDSHLEPNTNG